jgi:hypothetical protein
VERIDHMLIDRRRHSSILDVRYLRAADFDLVVANLGRDWQCVNKQRTKFNRKKLNKVENGTVLISQIGSQLWKT